MGALVRALGTTLLPCRIIAWSRGVEDSDLVPLCEGKAMQDERATAYVCANNTCLPPVVDPAAFSGLLKNLNG